MQVYNLNLLNCGWCTSGSAAPWAYFLTGVHPQTLQLMLWLTFLWKFAASPQFRHPQIVTACVTSA